MVPSFETARDLVVDAIHEYNGWVFKIGYMSIPVKELNLDSLDMVKIVLEIEEKAKITIDVKQLNKVVTVGDLVRVVWEHLPK